MKRLIIAAALLVVAATAFDDNAPVIRSFSYGFGASSGAKYIVHRIEDGPNTCYTLTGDYYSGQAVSISCVVRSK